MNTYLLIRCYTSETPRRMETLLLGDFTIHINKTDDRDAVEFNNILDQFGLVQHVSDATHRGWGGGDTIVQDTHAEDHGDFNIHINKTDDRDAVEFNNILDQFGLVQHVSDATHRGWGGGHNCTRHPC